MKFTSSFALAASLALVSAQDTSGIPSCAITCFAVAVPTSGCSITDTTCQCTTGRAKIEASLAQCVPGKCSASDAAQLVPAVQALCKKVGVTISSIPTPTAANQSGSAARTASVTGASTTPTGAAGLAHAAGMGAMALGVAAALVL